MAAAVEARPKPVRNPSPGQSAQGQDKGPMHRPYGPFRLAGGTHTEDYGLEEIVIKSFEGGRLIFEDGRVATVDGANLTVDGITLKPWIGARRVVAGALSAGDVVCLAEPRTHTVHSEPFMSRTDLATRHNSPGSTKFLVVHPDLTDELAQARLKIAELERQLASGMPPAPPAPQGQSESTQRQEPLNQPAKDNRPAGGGKK